MRSELKLSADKTALVVIDLQQGIAHKDRVLAPYTSTQVIEKAGRLVQTFTARGVFTVLVRVSTLDGKDMLKPKVDSPLQSLPFVAGWDSIVPELAEASPVHIVTKKQWGAFYGTDLDLQLRRRGIDTIVLCGISTSIGVDTTAREAYQHGYHQVFAEDAMTAASREEHDYVCRYIFPRLGLIWSADEIIRLLVGAPAADGCA